MNKSINTRAKAASVGAFLLIGFSVAVASVPSLRESALSLLVHRRVEIGSKAQSDGHSQSRSDGHGGSHGHDHGGHGHGEHDEMSMLELSDSALKNLGLTDEWIRPIRLSEYRQSITVPAVVAERPGRTHLQVATPLTGVITHVHALEGGAVRPGELLFEIRLTHEDLVRTQTEFLRTLGELDVELQEIMRLEDVTKSGAVPRVKLLEREYQREKLRAILNAQRESLRLHGLSEKQVERIEHDRRLLGELQIFAPSRDEHPENEFELANGQFHSVSWQKAADPEKDADPQPEQPPFASLVVSKLLVHKGQSVAAGETLAVMADYSDLYIECLAFEQDAPAISAAVAKGWTVMAMFDRSEGNVETLEGLQIIRLANEVDVESRTLKFFVRLPNEIVTRTNDTEANDLVGCVLFLYHLHSFERVPVHVIHRDQLSAVVASDGELNLGDQVAFRSAHQMQMALKNKAGGGVAAHAGHHH